MVSTIDREKAVIGRTVVFIKQAFEGRYSFVDRFEQRMEWLVRCNGCFSVAGRGMVLGKGDGRAYKISLAVGQVLWSFGLKAFAHISPKRTRSRLALSPQRHHQRINHKLSRHGRTEGSAHRRARLQVQYRRFIQQALSRPNVSEVGHPALIGLSSHKMAIQNIGRDAVFRT